MKRTLEGSLGDDSPKRNPWLEDDLGYAPFAEHIWRLVADTSAANGYVIGLHGLWGSGKSTIINFVLAHLQKNNAERLDSPITHIDFRPWIVSGHHDMIAAFFKVVTESLGPDEGRLKRLSKKSVRAVRGATDGIIDSAAKVAIFSDPTAGAAASAAGALAKNSLRTVIERFLAEPSLQKAYEDLKSRIRESNRRFLVTIDDIDRLEVDEIKTIMQMVKSVGQLPNVTYLLAYDREIVWNALRPKWRQHGPQYTEKIVQQEMGMPKPRRSSLLSMLNSAVGFISDTEDSSIRWHFIVVDGLYRWLKSPRDVIRLSNSVRFAWLALEDEIDPQDLLAMEGLRLFDPRAFDWLRNHRDLLFHGGRFYLASEGSKEEAAAELHSQIKHDREQVLELISALFPHTAKLIEGKNRIVDETQDEVAKRRGIGGEAGYDAYFGLQPSVDAIPKRVVDAVLAKLDDADYIETVIRSYLAKKDGDRKSMVGKLLSELLAQYRVNPPVPATSEMLDALFRVIPDLLELDNERELYQPPVRLQAEHIIAQLLGQWGEKEAGQRLLAEFEKECTLSFLANVYVDRGNELGIFPSRVHERPLVSLESFDRMGVILADKIRSAAETGALENASSLFHITKAWAHLDSPSVVKRWLNCHAAKSPEFMRKIGRTLLMHSSNGNRKHYTMHYRPEGDLYDSEVLIEAGTKHLARHDLTQDQRDVITEVIRGFKAIVAADATEGDSSA